MMLDVASIPDAIRYTERVHAYCVDCTGEQSWSLTCDGRTALAQASAAAATHRAQDGCCVIIEAYTLLRQRFGGEV